MQGPSKEEVFEAYAENNTPAAYHIFWYYDLDEKQITLTAIIPHFNHPIVVARCNNIRQYTINK